MDPDHSVEMMEKGLKPGDCLGTDMYPRIWTRINYKKNKKHS